MNFYVWILPFLSYTSGHFTSGMETTSSNKWLCKPLDRRVRFSRWTETCDTVEVQKLLLQIVWAAEVPAKMWFDVEVPSSHLESSTGNLSLLIVNISHAMPRRNTKDSWNTPKNGVKGILIHFVYHERNRPVVIFYSKRLQHQQTSIHPLFLLHLPKTATMIHLGKIAAVYPMILGKVMKVRTWLGGKKGPLYVNINIYNYKYT